MIRLNDFERLWTAIGPVALSAVERVGSSGRYVLGPEVERFEQALAEQWEVTHAVGVGNGLDALEIALRSLGLRPGEKVLTTPLSAFASTLAILRAGGVPVFVDVDPAGNIDLAQCREVLGRDRSIRFLLPVHLYGNPVNLGKLASLRDEFGLQVVEDCAQAICTQHSGQTVGTVGQAAATSFYPTKNLGALGDGGAILTNDAAVARQARTLRNYGQSAHYRHSDLGTNSRLDELHAAILCDALLPNLSAWTQARRDTARHYQERIRNPSIQLLQLESGSRPNWHLFPVLVAASRRDSFRQHLQSAGIMTGVHYPVLISEQPAMTRLGNPDVRLDLIRGRELVEQEVSLPIHPFLTEEEKEIVVAQCNRWKP